MNSNDVKSFIDECEVYFKTGNATEHTYRPAFKSLFEKKDGVIPVNEPKQSENGKPDFIFKKKSNPDIIIGYAEMKDPGISLDEVEKSEQWERYKNYTDIFLTDGFKWRFYKNGKEYSRITIVDFDKNNATLTALPDKFESLVDNLVFFFENSTEIINNGSRLAEIMGNKARMIRNYILKISSDDHIKNEQINSVYLMMKELLVSDLDVSKFADMYAQTLVYGLFVARYYDTTTDTFSRYEARELIPATNPLLREFFDHIAGANFSESLQPIVDSLCEVLRVSDVKKAVEQNRSKDEYRDPIIHFYEDFLESYDPELRKSMGAYYTPTPIVRYIIRAVDSSLKKDFDIEDGIASDDLIDYKRTVLEGYTKSKKAGAKTYFEENVRIPRVQLLDPAVGTATFLNETVKFIFDAKFKNQRGAWTDYVNRNLLPRLNGFEIMMTPYTIAHLKVGMTIKELGADDIQERLKVYLTNTLTEGTKKELPLYYLAGLVKAVTKESELASEVKNETPVMVVIGNPPYSIHSKNNSKYIKDLLKPYKDGLNERKVNLDDDYVKFIRFSESMIEKNQRGIVAMITNNSYLVGTSHRIMRKHLLKTFDKIYVLNLHGNSLDGERSPDGSADQNVFDIQKGVSIVVMIKNNSKKKEFGKVYYADLYGSRKKKFKALDSDKPTYKMLNYSEPDFYFAPSSTQITQSVPLNELFCDSTFTSGFRSGDAKNQICFTPEDVRNVVEDLIELSEDEYRNRYGLKDSRNHFYSGMKADIGETFDQSKVIKTLWHSLFDIKYTYYTENSSGFNAWPRSAVMNNLAYHNDNYALIFIRGHYDKMRSAAGITRYVSNERTFSKSGMQSADYVAPLYSYDEDGNRTHNFNLESLSKLTVNIGEQTPEDIFDYVFAELNSSSYFKEYEETLKTKFPLVPVPSKETFNRLVPLGRELRNAFLYPERLETNVGFPIAGNCLIEKVKYVSKTKRLYINDNQYFDNVPEDAWSSMIGANMPVQKWLKDRVGRMLSYQDIAYYEHIIAAVLEVERIMKEIG